MNIIEEKRPEVSYRFSIKTDGLEVARASLFIITNSLHSLPYGLLEDVFVEEGHRSTGLGKSLVQAVISKASSLSCYKLIATSRFERPRVHALYGELGFVKHGFEFRLQF